jgi:CPA1 family monovalent cation:H+ antiporter
MISTLETIILLLAVAAAVALAADRLKIPAAILLVLAGVGLALVPGLPAVELAPELVLLLILPPIIYSSAVAMSWREFRFNLRPIALLAIGCVVFTTVAVAAAAHLLLGLPWPVGFILGAIVSPPDVMAPLAIARRMQIPRRILVILEGEGLANDATALILYRFAVVAVSVGAFSFGEAVGSFLAIVVCEILWGIGVGVMMLRLRRWVREPRIEITLSLLTPFLAYWPPEHFGGSGVLATVTAGLYISWNGLRLISAGTRLQGVFFWGLLVYMIEGLVFLITGLQARTLVERIGGFAWAELITSALVISVVVIAARFIWMWPTIYVPRLVSTSLKRRDPAPPWTWAFALAFTGVRGIVSLAAALAIPLVTADGSAFPHRDLILFLTFAIILVTLVGQGLALPSLIRALGLEHAGRREHTNERAAEHMARRAAIATALERLDALAKERDFDADVLRAVRARAYERLHHIENRAAVDDGQRKLVELYDELECALIDAEREFINQQFRSGKLNDESRRRIERDLDLREARLANLRAED